ncbi:MAG: hypothetical protein ACI86H_000629 [bacterium]|jgi:hypothetical protein
MKKVLILGMIYLGILFSQSSAFGDELLFPNGDGSSFPDFSKQVELFAKLTPSKVKVGQVVQLSLLGRVIQGSHIYSVHSQGKNKPSSTKIRVVSTWFQKKGKTTESKTKIILDEAYQKKVNAHQGDFQIHQKYILKQGVLGAQKLQGKFTFQICNQRICSLPITKSFSTFFHISN